jgi:hypothetical protein
MAVPRDEMGEKRWFCRGMWVFLGKSLEAKNAVKRKSALYGALLAEAG